MSLVIKQHNILAITALIGAISALQLLPDSNISPTTNIQGIGLAQTSEEAKAVIVQGSNIVAVKKAVDSVGGEITHELAIINAVGTKLTLAQIQALRAIKGIRKVYDDSSVKTSQFRAHNRGNRTKLRRTHNNGVRANFSMPHEDSSAITSDFEGCSVKGESKIRFEKGNRVSWKITNTGTQDIHIDSIMALWPTANGSLLKVKIGRDKIFHSIVPGPTAILENTDWIAGDNKLTIKAGDREKFYLNFDKLNKVQENYNIRVFFREDCVIEFPPAPEELFAGDSDRKARRSFISTLTSADALHDEGIDGEGITVAVIDTGIWARKGKAKYLRNNAYDQGRIVAHYDALTGQELPRRTDSDENGHGSHLTSIILSSRYKDGEFNGIAPNANLIPVRAFDRDGQGSYADAIRALDWVLTNKDVYNIRVVNLSFSSKPQSHYWDDPLNQAVMAAWKAGLVIVASAGNNGPDAMSIGVPGNVPYVITVGAMTDSVTPEDPSDDNLASFSSAGPTFEGFVKPDIVAPGGHIRGIMKKENKLAKEHPKFHDGDGYYTMSGTSQSTAVVSGIVALMLQADPDLT
ncbi:MAG: S8 family peptidase, partial [Methylococcales bacterium]|nr:S8 family peptidase [Methylococcales bacterium]